MGKELKYISISTTVYILVRMVCVQVIRIYLGMHMHYLGSHMHCCTHVCAINSISFSQQGMAVCTCTEDHRRMLTSTVQYAAM